MHGIHRRAGQLVGLAVVPRRAGAAAAIAAASRPFARATGFEMTMCTGRIGHARNAESSSVRAVGMCGITCTSVCLASDHLQRQSSHPHSLPQHRLLTPSNALLGIRWSSTRWSMRSTPRMASSVTHARRHWMAMWRASTHAWRVITIDAWSAAARSSLTHSQQPWTVPSVLVSVRVARARGRMVKRSPRRPSGQSRRRLGSPRGRR